MIRTSFSDGNFIMSRDFAYCRVSTLEQNTENQRREIEAAGFTVKSQRLIEEHISGSVAASERPGFTRLLDRMENGGTTDCIGHQGSLPGAGRNGSDQSGRKDDHAGHFGGGRV